MSSIVLGMSAEIGKMLSSLNCGLVPAHQKHKHLNVVQLEIGSRLLRGNLPHH